MNQTDINRLADSLRRARESTVKRLKLVPKGKENAGIPDGAMSPADIADHLLRADQTLLELTSTRFKGKGLGIAGQRIVESRSEYSDLVAALEDMGDKRSDFVRGLTYEDLNTIIRFDAIAGPGEIDLYSMILRYLDHESHHRGALPIYLRTYKEITS